MRSIFLVQMLSCHDLRVGKKQFSTLNLVHTLCLSYLEQHNMVIQLADPIKQTISHNLSVQKFNSADVLLMCR